MGLGESRSSGTFGECTPESATSPGPICDAFGNLYGTSLAGGTNSDGTAFEVTP